jgi:hypothetical protein
MELPGLDRLIEVCRQLNLLLKTSPPGRTSLKDGMRMESLPFDPMLAAVYARFGSAAFAADVASLILHRFDDTEQKLEERNKRWSERHRDRLALPTFVFAGEPMMAYHYATVPSLADDQGRQPVVMVDVYEEPYAVPVASNVDQFFEVYSRYLEALLALPNAREAKASLLTFPFDIPTLIARDGRLVNLIQRGNFDLLLTNVDVKGWTQKVLTAGLIRT